MNATQMKPKIETMFTCCHRRVCWLRGWSRLDLISTFQVHVEQLWPIFFAAGFLLRYHNRNSPNHCALERPTKRLFYRSSYQTRNNEANQVWAAPGRIPSERKMIRNKIANRFVIDLNGLDYLFDGQPGRLRSNRRLLNMKYENNRSISQRTRANAEPFTALAISQAAQSINQFQIFIPSILRKWNPIGTCRRFGPPLSFQKNALIVS